MSKLLSLFVLLLLSIPSVVAAAPSASYRVETDSHGQPVIVVSGAGASVTLATIRAGLGNQSSLLTRPATGIWQLNASLTIGRDVQLTLSPDSGVRELRLRSQVGRAGTDPAGFDYSRFVYLRAENGTIRIDGVNLRSWDPDTGAPDTNPDDGRAYILAKYESRLDILNSDLGYLGSSDGESYGVAWRDTNSSEAPNILRQRVTGEVLNSRFHHNYYGVYTFQASGMIFRGNQFDHNLGYGFDPHDYSINFVIEDNRAFNNGNHGFIISRGCSGMVFRRNLSYANYNPDPSRLAHGFMLDPGSASSTDPQVPSTQNVLEQNQAYDNEGYGLRILGSNNNTVRENRFERNHQGMTVEQGSTGNVIVANTLAANRLHGIFVRGSADANRLAGNLLSGNGGHGIYVKANSSVIVDNQIKSNGGNGITLLPETGPAAALADLQLPATTDTDTDNELLGTVTVADTISGATISGNLVEQNAGHGIELKGVHGAELRANTISANQGHGIYLANGTHSSLVHDNLIAQSGGSGIRANGADTQANRWSNNQLLGNAASAVAVTSGANADVARPQLSLEGSSTVVGLASPGASIELLAAREPGRYLPITTLSADASGNFRSVLPADAISVLAITTRPDGNSSAAAVLPLLYQRIYLPVIDNTR